MPYDNTPTPEPIDVVKVSEQIDRLTDAFDIIEVLDKILSYELGPHMQRDMAVKNRHDIARRYRADMLSIPAATAPRVRKWLRRDREWFALRGGI